MSPFDAEKLSPVFFLSNTEYIIALCYHHRYREHFVTKNFMKVSRTSNPLEIMSASIKDEDFCRKRFEIDRSGRIYEFLRYLENHSNVRLRNFSNS